MEIIEALKQLDYANEAHWNKDGTPNMAAVEALVGDRSITRENVTEVAPQFSRTNLQFPGEGSPEKSEAQKKAEAEAEAKLKAESEAKAKAEANAKAKAEADKKEKIKVEAKAKAKAEAEHEQDEKCEDSEKQISICTDVITDLESQKSAIEKKLVEEKNKRDSLINRRPEAHKNNNQQTIMDHIKKSNERRAAKYEQHGKQASKLDKSMEHRRGFGNTRPNFNG